MIQKHWTKILLALIILLAIFLRFYGLGRIPQGFQVDEVAFGYNAYSIMQTGRDEFGKLLPLTLRSFDDYKAAVYSYLTIPFIKVFGLTELAVRLPSAVLGVLMIPLVFFIVKRITKNNKLALLSALLCAISPSLIFLSRVQSDPLAACFFILLGLCSFLLFIDKKQWPFLITAFFLWAVGYYTYQYPRIFLLFFAPILFMLYHKSFTKNQKILYAAGFIVLVILSAYLFKQGANARFTQVSVFKSPAVQLPLNEAIREEGHNGALTARVFNNKPIGYGRFLVGNFFDYISPHFLFFEAVTPLREKVPDAGIMYLLEFPFLLIGAYQIIRKKQKWGYFFLAWFLLTAASLSFINDDSPNIHRFMIADFALEIIAAFGIQELFSLFKKKQKMLMQLCAIILVVAYAYSTAYFWHNLFVRQPVHQPWARNYAYKDLVYQIDHYAPQFKKTVISVTGSNTYIFILFYNKYDPAKYQASGSLGNVSGKGFDNYIFDHEDCPLQTGINGIGQTKGEYDVLYVDSGNCITGPDVKVLQVVRWRDNSPAFKLVYLIKPVTP